MKILIPPSEGKSKENTSNIAFGKTEFLFKNEIKKVLEKLSECENNALTNIYGSSHEKSVIQHKENLELFNNECSLAIERYSGVVYSYFDYKSLNDSSKVFSNNNILITSGMLGLVKLNDLIPNYKLKMNVLKLTSFWNPIFTKSLKNEDFILDLLPEVHRKSYSSDRSIKIDFKFLKDNKSVSAGHNGKAIKGKFLRFIAENNLERLEEILTFNEDGFIWDKNAFVKKI